jgi:hypothetical protein
MLLILIVNCWKERAYHISGRYGTDIRAAAVLIKAGRGIEYSRFRNIYLRIIFRSFDLYQQIYVIMAQVKQMILW